ncbi:hypothetical protein CHLNCDRAFT_134722 [Chlorella variabilis]|uniref:RNA polymerase II C-terminal domain phosphatase-like n=1 Tax=Chlorella variabilis TaxID=554065 RepID=E1ZGL7_CHLVA|nr:hypothetical protein CHLNCDRAFT_134722 [Chlorella variabilis]EFN54779.1 hypothetical protein CHLNCDRAFT_134722 [Chlorella variabilis]|eukprot:XP_005846881.1 hypothetical protein CHLNCDRAFT_134722 [Chlorella variabilis]
MSLRGSESEDDLAALLEAELAASDGDTGVEEACASDAPAPKKPRLDMAAGTVPAASTQCPPHPGFMGGICIRCGALKGEAEEQGVALTYIHRGLVVSKHEAERVRQGTADRLLAHRKLLLILDLDHTLLNSTRFTEVPPQGAVTEQREGGEQALRAQLEAQPKGAPMLYCLPHMRMWTKLRPGVREFLEAAKDRQVGQVGFELAVYTMGDRDYAGEMAKLLDPAGSLFHGRIISSGDSTQRYVKDLDVVLGRERCVLILDDTEGVWPRHRDNLVQIERYLYFPADAARFGFRSQSLLERAVDEEGGGGALATCLRVMSGVQQQFFEQGDPGAADVRPLLGAARRAVLAECRLLFSRVMPLDCADPSAHPLWQLALKLGAECVRETGQGVTHVVATDTTDKTRWACGQGKHVVSPSWLWCCAYTWQRADEAGFPVKAGGDAAAARAAAPRSEAEDVAQAMAAAGGGAAADVPPPAEERAQPAAAAAGLGKKAAAGTEDATPGDDENTGQRNGPV